MKKALYKIDHLRKSAIFDHAKYFVDFRKRLQLIIFDGGVFPMVSKYQCYLSPSNQGTVTVNRTYKVDNVTRAAPAITGLLRRTLAVV